MEARRAAVRAAGTTEETVFGGEIRHHLLQRCLQREQVVRFQHQQHALLYEYAPNVRAQHPAVVFRLVQPSAPLQFRRICPYPQ